MNFLLVDFSNLYFRARHVAHKQSDDWDRLGFSIHTTLASMAKAWREQRADHVVVCLEGRSWRKSFYKPYKANRAEARAALTEAEQETDRLFWETYDALCTYMREHTNCTVLRHDELEADDCIAAWIQSHPEDQHVIVSSDSDFYQLLAPNVVQYNGIQDELYTVDGIFDGRGRKVIDKKTKEPKRMEDPAWILFQKCIRGDSTDYVFSAYPGARVKGTKNKVGIMEAFQDRASKGYAWNNFMLQRWTDHLDVEHRVLDDYERNRTLIDLSAQPPEIRAKMMETVKTASVTRQQPMIGAHFLKLCGKYELKKLSDNAQQYAEMLSAAYKPQ